MSDQVDLAVDLGALPPALPEILTFQQLMESAPKPPPQIIKGVLHQGCKMVLGGTSKSNKSWCLLDLALSVASGQKWWGWSCTKLPVGELSDGDLSIGRFQTRPVGQFSDLGRAGTPWWVPEEPAAILTA